MNHIQPGGIEYSNIHIIDLEQYDWVPTHSTMTQNHFFPKSQSQPNTEQRDH